MRPRPFGFAQDGLRVALRRKAVFFWKSNSDNGMMLGMDYFAANFASTLPLALMLRNARPGRSQAVDMRFYQTNPIFCGGNFDATSITKGSCVENLSENELGSFSKTNPISEDN
jgi:hypothetical protein